jgi:hypothetical protein
MLHTEARVFVARIMNQPILVLLVGVLLQVACAECRYYNDCDVGQACSGGVCEDLEGFTCEQGGESPFFLPRGFVESGEHWQCNLPPVASNAAPFFASFDGPLTLVSGGSGKFTFFLNGATDLTGRTVIIGVRGERTYHVLNDVPVTDGRVEAELFISPSLRSGPVLFSVAIDDGKGTPGSPSLGQELEVPLNIIGVSSGDIQISITWDAYTDVDLFVQDPGGNVIYFAAKESPTGGRLDLDSNAACNPPFRQNENVFWPPSTALSGTYNVWVNLWSQCDHSGPTNWRMTRVLEKTDFEVLEGVLAPPDTPNFTPGNNGRPPDLTFQF